LSPPSRKPGTGFLGSRAYINEQFASRPEANEPGPDQMPSSMRNEPPAPTTLEPGHAKLSAYFNLDNGTGKIRGIYLQENAAVKPVFEAWMESVKDLGASRGTMRNTGGTGHQAFDGVGLPGFQFIQDPIGQGGPDRRAPPGSGYPEAWSASPRSRSSCCPRTRTPWARSSAA